MSRRSFSPLPRCLFCGRMLPLGRSADVLTVRLDGPGRERIDLRWHMSPCASDDPLHMELADAFALRGARGDDAARAAYLKIAARAREHGADALRAMIDIRRDINDQRQTLRGPGLSWGILSPRLRRG